MECDPACMKKVTVTVGNESDRRNRLQDKALRAIKAFRGGDRIPRDEIHRRVSPDHQCTKGHAVRKGGP